MIITGCGTNPKEEVEKLHTKYMGYNGQIYQINTVDLMRLKTSNDKISKETVDGIKELAKKMNKVSEDIKREKVSEESNKYKNLLMEYCLFSSKQLSFLAERDAKALNKESTEIEQNEFIKTAKTAMNKRADVYDEYYKVVKGKNASYENLKNMKAFLHESSSVKIFAMCGQNDLKKIDSGFGKSVKPVGKFYKVTIYVYNNQKDAIVVDSSYFKLVDKQGREFSVSTAAQTATQLKDGSTKGFLTQLNPGMGTDFKFIYDVPKNTDIMEYGLQARGGATGDKIIIPLNPVIRVE